MDDNLSGERYLFAWAITDGALDNYPEERKKERTDYLYYRNPRETTSRRRTHPK